MIRIMPEEATEAYLELAKRLALGAREIAHSNRGRQSPSYKADTSVVTETDHAIQQSIVQAIRECYPDHAIIAEEEQGEAQHGADPATARFCWVIDPLDGTRNFVAGFPCFATSIALLDTGTPIVGVIADHNVGDVYEASANCGARRNGESLHVVEPAAGRDYLIGCPSTKDSLTVRVVCEWASTKGIVLRNTGSTALHLALVASGALKGAFAKRCKIWDVAAGYLLIREAGSLITNLAGDSLTPFVMDADPSSDVPFLAGTPAIHAKLQRTTSAIQ